MKLFASFVLLLVLAAFATVPSLSQGTVPGPIYLPIILKSLPAVVATVTRTPTRAPAATSTPTRQPATATPTATATTETVFVCSSNFYNCSDFSTQAQAQTVFNYCFVRGFGDIHGLDGDGNGLACESLP